MRKGLYISGALHAGLILWLLLGSLFQWDREEDLVQVSEVSMISEDEFAALSAPANDASSDAAITPNAAVTPEPEPVPEPDLEVEPAPVPEPVPELAPEAVPDILPDIVPETKPSIAPEAAPPAPAPRVAEEAAPAPETPVEDAPEPVTAPAPDPDALEQAEPEDITPAAPPEATTEIVTEAETSADAPVEVVSAAPTSSARPKTRPARPVPAVEPAPVQTNAAAAVAQAVADQVSQETDTGDTASVTSDIPLGPPMTRGEKEGLRVSVSRCWNLGSSSTQALSTTVVVQVKMSREGKPEGIKMLSWEGPSKAAGETAFQAARRAIIRCGARGFDLPKEKYGQWREIEMTFNPEKMRVK